MGGGLRKVPALPWCSLQPSLALGSWEMNGEGRGDKGEGGWRVVLGPVSLWKMPSGCAQSRWGETLADVGTCHLGRR